MNCQNLFSGKDMKRYFKMSSTENFTQHAERLKQYLKERVPKDLN